MKARKAAGWTQNELHQRTGISRDVIKGYETGRNKPGARELRLLCEALQVSPNRLLFGRDDFRTAAGPVKGLVSGLGADPGRKMMSLVILFGMLTPDEQDAVLTLVEPIIVGRKGGKSEIRKAFKAIEIIGNEYAGEIEETAEAVMRKNFTEERLAGIEKELNEKK